MMVFMAAALALVTSTAVSVALGTVVEHCLIMVPMKLRTGIWFLLIGMWTFWAH
jgi:putative Ca2+/H+ antiporter (TMEM165/GDT1 family)